MRIATYQCPSPAGDIAAGVTAIDTALSQAASVGADMLVMPELFLPGYNAVTATPAAGLHDAIAAIPAMCQRHGVALTIGLPEYSDGAVYNAACAWGAEGALLARYRKVQLFGPAEKSLYTAGQALCMFEYRGTRFGLMICYDVEFPEHVRHIVRAGATAILTPTANMAPYAPVSLVQVPGRALENGITIAYANYCGREGDLDYVGLSVITGPDGAPLASRGAGTGLLVADLPGPAGAGDLPRSTQLADFRPIDQIGSGLDQ